MKQAIYQQKARVCEILESSFAHVPGIEWIIGNGLYRKRKFKKLIDIAVEMSFCQGEVCLSDNEKGVLLFFRQHQRTFSLKVLWLYLRLAVEVIGILRLPEMLRRERYLKQMRPPKTMRYLYVWFIAAESAQDNEAILDLKNSIFRISLEENLPIYMETTVPKASMAYMRYGFELFHKWQNPKRRLSVWFFRRTPMPGNSVGASV